MPFSDIFTDLLSSLSLTEAHAEAPPAEDKPEEKEEESGESEDKSEGGEEGEKDEGGDDEGGDDAGGDEGEDEAEEKEEEEEEEEEEVEDIKPKLEAECAKSSQCAPLKHHYDACAERVQKQQEDEDHKGPKEDCVEEFMYNIHSLNRQQSPREEEEQQRLLGQGTEWEEMADRISAADTKDPITENTQTQDTTASEQNSDLEASQDAAQDSNGGDQAQQPTVVY
ncbi:MAG: hypothetical protein Q9212_003718, partial [Teloschistes hypoglaucus]